MGFILQFATLLIIGVTNLVFLWVVVTDPNEKGSIVMKIAKGMFWFAVFISGAALAGIALSLFRLF